MALACLILCPHFIMVYENIVIKIVNQNLIIDL